MIAAAARRRHDHDRIGCLRAGGRDLGDFLKAMGARIEGLGTPVIEIEGVSRLSAVEHAVIPDRIEAATLMLAAAITRGRVMLTNVRPDHLTTVLDKLRQIGVSAKVAGDTIEVRADAPLKPWIASPCPIRDCRPTCRLN